MATSMYEPVVLAASAAVTATGNGSAFRLPECRGLGFVLDLTNAATDVGDELDVSIQMKLDGTNWVDVVHFTQILGNGSNTLRFFGKISADGAMTMFENGSALAAAAIRNLIGLEMRAAWVVVPDADDPADQTFTFSVVAIPM